MGPAHMSSFVPAPPHLTGSPRQPLGTVRDTLGILVPACRLKVHSSDALEATLVSDRDPSELVASVFSES